MMDDNSIPVQQIDETNLLITVRFLSDPKCSYLQKEGTWQDFIAHRPQKYFQLVSITFGFKLSQY